MRFSASSIVATFVAVGMVAASPITRAEKRDFNCNVEQVQCCKQTMTQKEASKAFAGLLILDDIVGNVGLSCTPLGISAGSCGKSAPVCCSQVHQSGLVNMGCTPLSVL